MAFIRFVTAAVLANAALSTPVPQSDDNPAQYCDAATTICYSEWVSPENIAYRVAIPDTAVAGSFDVLLQIEAPTTVGWAGLAWGGVMVNNPLTIAWANEDGVVVSSRSATPYTGATYAVLPGSTANSTHWSITVLAQGLSSWGSTSLDPAGTISVAYAQSGTPPTEPANNASRFSIHNSHAKWTLDLKASQIANFAELVANASAPLAGGVGNA
ncbi:hypothetical protein B0J18DRAFT_474219 [Chaetomium sp. MPI-SDFR-AT-0129]|nr:hypothetical protein B0J18DRAFT_474219 [Chaetomium sp. MPI-SDFR-AT-0129]